MRQMDAASASSTEEKHVSKRLRVDTNDEAVHKSRHILTDSFRSGLASRDLMPPPELPPPVRKSSYVSRPYNVPHYRSNISPTIMSNHGLYHSTVSTDNSNPSNHAFQPRYEAHKAQNKEVMDSDRHRHGIRPNQHESHKLSQVFDGQDIAKGRNISHDDSMFDGSRAISNDILNNTYGQVTPVQSHQPQFTLRQFTPPGTLRRPGLTSPGFVRAPQLAGTPRIDTSSTARRFHQYFNDKTVKPHIIRSEYQPLHHYSTKSNFQMQTGQPEYYHSFYQLSNPSPPPVYNDSELDRQRPSYTSLPTRNTTSPFFTPSSHLHTRPNHTLAVPTFSNPITPQRSNGLVSHIHSSHRGFQSQSRPLDAVVSNVTSPFFGKKTVLAGPGRTSMSRRRVQR